MKDDQLYLMIEISKAYYYDKMKQDEVAKKYGISKATVSRMLEKAKDAGIVRTIVVDLREKEIETALAKKFGLKIVRVADIREGDTAKKAIGREAAGLLLSILRPGDMVGVAWGTTLLEMVNYLPNTAIYELKVVQLKGNILDASNTSIAMYVAKTLGEKLGAEVTYLPLPVMVGDKAAREVLENDIFVKEIKKMGEECNIALFSIGKPDRSSIIAKYGYITGNQLEDMHKAGAVGDICSRFFKLDGTVFDQELDERTTSIPLESLKKKEYSIGMAGGAHNVEGILGAIRGGYINTLVTDKETANELLDSKITK